MQGEPSSTSQQGVHYWVVGGVYQSTAFENLVSREDEERHGPFVSYQDALNEWSRLSWRDVDNAHARYRIEVKVEDRH